MKTKGTRASPHFYLAFSIGLMPKDIIDRGEKPSLVYYYHRKFTRFVKPDFEKLMKITPKESRSQRGRNSS